MGRRLINREGKSRKSGTSPYQRYGKSPYKYNAMHKRLLDRHEKGLPCCYNHRGILCLPSPLASHLKKKGKIDD